MSKISLEKSQDTTVTQTDRVFISGRGHCSKGLVENSLSLCEFSFPTRKFSFVSAPQTVVTEEALSHAGPENSCPVDPEEAGGTSCFLSSLQWGRGEGWGEAILPESHRLQRHLNQNMPSAGKRAQQACFGVWNVLYSVQNPNHWVSQFLLYAVGIMRYTCFLPTPQPGSQGNGTCQSSPSATWRLPTCPTRRGVDFFLVAPRRGLLPQVLGSGVLRLPGSCPSHLL